MGAGGQGRPGGRGGERSGWTRSGDRNRGSAGTGGPAEEPREDNRVDESWPDSTQSASEPDADEPTGLFLCDDWDESLFEAAAAEVAPPAGAYAVPAPRGSKKILKRPPRPQPPEEDHSSSEED